ncbi:MAG: thioredoxin family protein [Desulfobulbaceae bacterium]|nr:thioredoxin family protein [Desulfobulbaceae bacterium]
MYKNIVLIAALFLVTACSDEQANTEGSQLGQANASSPPSIASSTVAQVPKNVQNNLLFFMDPNGGPCRMQDGILTGMSEELQSKINIRYVKTTNQNDIQLFHKYGIRALPTLLLTDGAGKEIKRMPPGIKDAATIRALINQPPPRV